jgi:hypothetical protein
VGKSVALKLNFTDPENPDSGEMRTDLKSAFRSPSALAQTLAKRLSINAPVISIITIPYHFWNL